MDHSKMDIKYIVSALKYLFKKTALSTINVSLRNCELSGKHWWKLLQNIQNESVRLKSLYMNLSENPQLLTFRRIE
jgi:hypothetical protein